MPLETIEKILSLANAGASVIFLNEMPDSVNGLNDLPNKTKRFDEAIGKLELLSRRSSNATVLIGSDIGSLLNESKVTRETMVDAGIDVLRKKSTDGGSLYFIKNKNAIRHEGWIPIRNISEGVMIFDPMTARYGKGRIKKTDEGMLVFVQLEADQTLILKAYNEHSDATDFLYLQPSGPPESLTGTWKVSFDSGGPVLPASFASDSLVFWTDMPGEEYQNFSGTATYELTFNEPNVESERWLLKMDSIKESAEIIINGKSIGTLLGPSFQIEIDGALLEQTNVIQIRVANLMANRIAWLDRNKVFWKKFYNIDFPSRRRENTINNLFTAAHWKPKPSGVSGRVALYPLKDE